MMAGIERWYSKFDGICDDLLSDEEEEVDRAEKEKFHNLAQRHMEKLRARPKPTPPSKRRLAAVKEGACSICGTAFLWDQLMRCQRCFRSPFYCSEKCQKKDLRRHKKEHCVAPAFTQAAELMYRGAEIAADQLFHIFQLRIHDEQMPLFRDNLKASLGNIVQVSKMLPEPGMIVFQFETVTAIDSAVLVNFGSHVGVRFKMMHFQLPLSSCNEKEEADEEEKDSAYSQQCREQRARVEDAIRRAKLEELWKRVYLDKQFLLGIFVHEIDALFLAVLDLDPPANITMPTVVSASPSLARDWAHQLEKGEAFHNVRKLMSDIAVGNSTAKNDDNNILWLKNIFDPSRGFYTRTELKNKMTAMALKKALKRECRRRCRSRNNNTNNGSEEGCVTFMNVKYFDFSGEQYYNRVSQFIADPNFVVGVFHLRLHIQSPSIFLRAFVFRAVVEN